MTTGDRHAPVVLFYDSHPISERQIIDKMMRDGVELHTLTEERLKEYDQDHFGGAQANDVLATSARIDRTCHVLDPCCGLGGPARYLAHNYGCRVTGVDLTESRVQGARRFTEMVGLETLVTYRMANALDLPNEDDHFDVVFSQESFCHIPDKQRLISECVRVLKPGGRIAFTDIVATEKTDKVTRDRLQREMAFFDLATRPEYENILKGVGCRDVQTSDQSEHWAVILMDRLKMYRGLKDQTVERFGQAHFEGWDNAYSHFVGLYSTGELGGVRIVATRSEH